MVMVEFRRPSLRRRAVLESLGLPCTRPGDLDSREKQATIEEDVHQRPAGFLEVRHDVVAAPLPNLLHARMLT